jgi:hypothetical protein
MAEWSIATDCKSVALTGYLGSNPGLSTSIASMFLLIDKNRINCYFVDEYPIGEF